MNFFMKFIGVNMLVLGNRNRVGTLLIHISDEQVDRALIIIYEDQYLAGGQHRGIYRSEED